MKVKEAAKKVFRVVFHENFRNPFMHAQEHLPIIMYCDHKCTI